MRGETLKHLVLVAVFGYLICTPAPAQQTPANVPAKTAVLVPQPESPLQLLSMQPVTTQARGNVPPQVAQAAADYEIVARNLSNAPIMAYAIRHEWRVGTRHSRTCQSALGFSEAAVGAGETKTIQAHLQKEGTGPTPIVDLVLLQDGTYFGENLCGVLTEYTNRLGERQATYQTVMNLIQRDGVDKTTAWINAQLARDVRPLLAPKKMK